MLNSLSFCLSVKLVISPSYLDEILAGYTNLGCRFFSFITLCTSFWPEEFLLKDQPLSLWESPCVLFVVFLPLATFNICSKCLISVNLINMCWGVYPWVYPVWDSLGFLELGD